MFVASCSPSESSGLKQEPKAGTKNGHECNGMTCSAFDFV
jgi:hypothetical protein